ncbi:uncharacterized protein BHQ10_005656 [Talaromyces amestolkiae]|uniref:Uncharacterized protein n=1 Tax=Talaromyces amestolkiae TaxID=1196081 RepID=A0A364L1I7_TALAM|nr:uncharacterized protein BHQ10_005656 [Talaromyces amestolkiae]RAO69644.1 hypothetical protein BHQ10_005656 [Talaromyces amestolkiae]
MMSSRLPHTLHRTAITAQTGFAAASIRNSQRVITRRSYAEAHYHERKKGNVPWLFLSVALTVPVAYYLYNSRSQETAHGAGPKRSLVKGREEGAKVSGEKQSERDPAHAIKPIENIGKKSGTQTAKQQGVSNDDTMHPELYASGKSEKPEGVTETAKLKGTVSLDRGKGKS